MKYKDWLKLMRKYRDKTLNGKFIAYEKDKPIGEIVYKKGKVISKRKYKD